MKTRTPIRPVIVAPKYYLPHILAVLFLWSLVMTLDYYDQVNGAEEARAQAVGQLLDCLNGVWRGVDEEGTELGCLPVQTNRKRR